MTTKAPITESSPWDWTAIDESSDTEFKAFLESLTDVELESFVESYEEVLAENSKNLQ